jgi:glyoxylase-like metal-dependent hydrolase (beta-lactamase superfamily II)
MRLQRLIAGWMTAPAAMWRAGDPDEPARVPVPVYLVETATERILVDCGLHPRAVEDAAAHYAGAPSIGLFALEQETAIDEQVDLATLTGVVLTHLHFDHAGGLELVPAGVPLYVQRREWEAAHDDAAIRRNFLLPRDYAGRSDVVLIDGDHDLLGDGTIELLLTPGHTHGHQSIRVEDVVIGADVVHYATSLDDLRFPPFGDDHETQGRSAQRLRALRDAGLTVLPGHDPEILDPGPVKPGDATPNAT